MSVEGRTDRDAADSAVADRRVLGALAFGFVGLIYHNLREFPVSVLWRGDTLMLLGITVALAWWWTRSRSRGAATALLGWGLLHVIGGGLIVGGGLVTLVRDLAGAAAVYDLDHHTSHWIYGATYLPLVRVAWRRRRELRSGPVAMSRLR